MPASRTRSVDASVWPPRTSTPWLLAMSGKTWPGRVNSSGRVCGDAKARSVVARSLAEMPVVVPATASTLVTVPKAAALLGSAATASRRGPGSGRLFAPTADPRFRRTERIVLETPLVSTTATVTARLLNRVGQAMNVPVTLSERIDESLLLRVSVAELALAPLALGEYVIEVTATAGAVTETISYAVRIVP